MFSVDRDFGSTTSNISCCSGAPGVPRGGPGNGAANAHRAHSLTVRCDTDRHHWLAPAPREPRLTTAAEAAWLAAGSFLSRRESRSRRGSRSSQWYALLWRLTPMMSRPGPGRQWYRCLDISLPGRVNVSSPSASGTLLVQGLVVSMLHAVRVSTNSIALPQRCQSPMLLHPG